MAFPHLMRVRTVHCLDLSLVQLRFVLARKRREVMIFIKLTNVRVYIAGVRVVV